MNDKPEQNEETGASVETEEQDLQSATGESVDIASLIEENRLLQEEVQRTRDQLLRKAAEFQNYRRRTEEEKRVLVQIGKASVVEQMLDVVDDLARSVDAARDESATADSLRQGIEMVYQKMLGELRKLNVEPITSVGTTFNENLHEAMVRQPAPEGVAPGTVLHEIQRGYRMDDRVLRHARVVVAADID